MSDQWHFVGGLHSVSSDETPVAVTGCGWPKHTIHGMILSELTLAVQKTINGAPVATIIGGLEADLKLHGRITLPAYYYDQLQPAGSMAQHGALPFIIKVLGTESTSPDDVKIT